MRVIKGQLKLQYDLLCIHEMLEFKPAPVNAVTNIVGYAAFDLQHQRVGRFCRFYSEMIVEMKRLSKNARTDPVLLAA